MFSFSPAVKLESLVSGSESITESTEETSRNPSCFHPLLNSSATFFQNLTNGGGGGGTEPSPLTMLRRLGWDAADLTAGGGDRPAVKGYSGRPEGGPFALTGTLAATAERLQADYLQYCIAKESARLFYSRLAALQQHQPRYSPPKD